MTLLQVLCDTRAYLADANHWSKGAYARNKRHQIVTILDPLAFKFCLSGMVCATAHPGPRNLTHETITYLESILDDEYHSIPDFNDACTHDELLAFLNKAIDHVVP